MAREHTFGWLEIDDIAVAREMRAIEPTGRAGACGERAAERACIHLGSEGKRLGDSTVTVAR